MIAVFCYNEADFANEMPASCLRILIGVVRFYDRMLGVWLKQSRNLHVCGSSSL